MPKVEAWWSTVSEHSNDQFTSDGAIIASVTEVVDTAPGHPRSDTLPQETVRAFATAIRPCPIIYGSATIGKRRYSMKLERMSCS